VTARFRLGHASRKPLLVAGSGTASLVAEEMTVKLGPASYAVFRVDAAAAR
jgi:hypothetical protein